MAPDGPPVTEHETLTEPVNPPEGVMVMVEVVDPPGLTAGGAVELNWNAAGVVVKVKVALLTPL